MAKEIIKYKKPETEVAVEIPVKEADSIDYLIFGNRGIPVGHPNLKPSDERMKQLNALSEQIKTSVLTRAELDNFYKKNNLKEDIEKVIVVQDAMGMSIRAEGSMTLKELLHFFEERYLEPMQMWRVGMTPPQQDYQKISSKS